MPAIHEAKKNDKFCGIRGGGGVEISGMFIISSVSIQPESEMLVRAKNGIFLCLAVEMDLFR